MIENEIAKFEKPPISRKSCWAYPRRSRSRMSCRTTSSRLGRAGIADPSEIARFLQELRGGEVDHEATCPPDPQADPRHQADPARGPGRKHERAADQAQGRTGLRSRGAARRTQSLAGR